MLIGSDPRSSPRPGEAIRIAAGIGAWQKVKVDIYLHDAAAACLHPFPEELRNGQLIEQYLPSIPAHGGQIFVQAGKAQGMQLRADLKFIEVSRDGLEKLLSEMDYWMNFDGPLPDQFRPSGESSNYDELLDRIFAEGLADT
jgi:hypothetical protein